MLKTFFFYYCIEIIKLNSKYNLILKYIKKKIILILIKNVLKHKMLNVILLLKITKSYKKYNIKVNSKYNKSFNSILYTQRPLY